MNALQRVSAILERARVAGGWIDDIVAAAVLSELGLDWDGQMIAPPPAPLRLLPSPDSNTPDPE